MCNRRGPHAPIVMHNVHATKCTLTTNACSQGGHVDVARLLIEKGAEVPHSDTLTPHYYGYDEGDDSYDMYLCMTGVL